MSFGVLFVCTGNICRSPMAERLFRARTASVPGVSAASAGTRALAGHAMDAAIAGVLAEFGGDPSAHVARQITGELVDAADLVLSAQSAQRAALVQAFPLAFRRVFTMREFARLGAGFGPLPAPVTDAALRERVAQVAGRRGSVEPPAPGADEIGDPFGAPMDVVRATAARIDGAVDEIVANLGLDPRGYDLVRSQR